MPSGRDDYDASEQDEVLDIFRELLVTATRDGGVKRAAGAKPPWRIDEHRQQIFTHLGRWVNGERHDPDSGAHPLVHAAWRCLAVAWQETHWTGRP